MAAIELGESDQSGLLYCSEQGWRQLVVKCYLQASPSGNVRLSCRIVPPAVLWTDDNVDLIYTNWALSWFMQVTFLLSSLNVPD